MPESQSEFDLRMLKFRVQNLENQFQAALSGLRDQLAGLGSRVAALEQHHQSPFPAPPSDAQDQLTRLGDRIVELEQRVKSHFPATLFDMRGESARPGEAARGQGAPVAKQRALAAKQGAATSRTSKKTRSKSGPT